jgi:hypothetical protein
MRKPPIKFEEISKKKPDLLMSLTSTANLLSKASLPKNVKLVLVNRFLKVCSVEEDLFSGTEDTGIILVSAFEELSEQIKVLESYSEKGII